MFVELNVECNKFYICIYVTNFIFHIHGFLKFFKIMFKIRRISVFYYKNYLKFYLIKIFSAIVPLLVPPIHIYILYKFWNQYSRRVDKKYCSCSCWDTVFKGTYETGIASYKHMYFNATSNTTKIWFVTVACIILLYECVKFEFKLIFNFQLRIPMAILFLSSLFSHYYTWWVYLNYLNDDFYFQWNHQMFFTLTEILSTTLVLQMSDKKTPISPSKILVIISIAVIHILAGSLDQFVSNVLLGEGYTHQVIRDIAFVVPDILHTVVPTIELFKYQKQNNELSRGKCTKFVLYLLGLILLGCTVSLIL